MINRKHEAGFPLDFTFVTLVEAFLSQPRGKHLIYLQESGVLLVAQASPRASCLTADPGTCPHVSATCPASWMPSTPPCLLTVPTLQHFAC